MKLSALFSRTNIAFSIPATQKAVIACEMLLIAHGIYPLVGILSPYNTSQALAPFQIVSDSYSSLYLAGNKRP